MTPTERLYLLIVLVALAAVVWLRADAREIAWVADCHDRGGMPMRTIDGELACVDSATIVALPARS